jgi:ABC-type uncharacterized transport system ATPase subunit
VLAAEGGISELKAINYSLYELRIKGEKEGFLHKLKDLECKVEEREDGILKVYMPPNQSKQEIFRIASEEKIQVRHFVKSQTSLEDKFADVVGVD